MMMSLIFIVVFVSLFLLPLTILTILMSLHHSSSDGADRHQGRSISNLLLGNTFLPNQTKFVTPCNFKGIAGIKLYQKGKNEDENSKVECGVCLSVIEEGDEIREMRCNHLFHKDCLDSWVNTGRATCPMCRGAIHSPTMVEGSLQSGSGSGMAELLVFEFCSSSSNRSRKDNWWIR